MPSFVFYNRAMSLAPGKTMRLLPVLVIGALLPAIFVAINVYLLDRWELAPLMAALVCEVGLTGPLCAKFIQPRWLMWLIYTWIWLVMDMMVVPLSTHEPWQWESISNNTLPVALLDGQLGLVVVWATLSPTRWTTRWPAALLLAIAILVPVAWHRMAASELLILLFLQNAVVFGICIFLRWMRFRLMPPPTYRDDFQTAETPNAPASLRDTQFQLRDVLVWTTVLAIVLAVSRAIDSWSTSLAAWEQMKAGLIRNVFSPAVLPTPTAAICTSIALLVAIWAALGAGRAITRWAVFFLIVAAVAMTHGFSDFYQLARSNRWTEPLWDYWDIFLEMEQALMFWHCLAGGMLFAALLMFRSLGYRLRRVKANNVKANNAV